MAAWFTAVAPFLPDIIQMAKPIFTRSKGEEKAPDLVPRQIAELQDAAAQNAESVRVLAAEMQQTLTALQQASGELERKLERANRLSLVAATAAVLAFAVAAYALAT
ncbi:hypothetical protein [Lysobacter sp. F6437]|uniref:hypothetical protein n=1 Tax=Lysobacter sp. F6437 TaxID=3459296 RepID=UPI00403D67B6